MSEEIIIDDVNVAECEHRNDIYKTLLADGAIKKFSNYCRITNDGCYGVNCYYKQLKRLEQENTELKKENKENLHYLACMTEQRNKLKLALEEIREMAKNYFEKCGVPDDYFKRNNYSWKQHQIKGLTCKLQQIFDKSNEVLKDER